MANAYTLFLNLIKPEEGGDRDAWGGHWNSNANTLDTWAKATDTLAKDAVAKTPTGGASQTVAGDLIATNVGLSATGKLLRLGPAPGTDGYIATTAEKSSTDIVPASDVFRVVNRAFNRELLRLDPPGAAGSGIPAYLRLDNSVVWHASNLTPLDRTLGGDLTAWTRFRNVAARFFRDGVREWAIDVNADAGLYVSDYTAGSTAAVFQTNHDLWLGYWQDTVHNRIESRAAAYADDRAAGRVAKYNSGREDMSGPLQVVNYLDIVRGGYYRWRLETTTDSGKLKFENGDSGVSNFEAWTDGNLWSRLWSDTVHNRIEGRAAAYADDRLNTANANARSYAESISVRLSNTGNNPIDGNPGNMWEPAGGGVMTGWLAQYVNGTWQMTLVKLRQLQRRDSYGNWAAISYPD